MRRLAALLLACFVGAAQEPASAWRDFAASGAWCWFGDPRAVRQGDKTHAGWIDRKGDLCVATYDHATKEIRRAVLHERFQRDDHDNPSLLVRADGRLAVFYSRHGGKKMFLRISKRPGDVSLWEDERIRTVRT